MRRTETFMKKQVLQGIQLQVEKQVLQGKARICNYAAAVVVAAGCGEPK